jgi:ubiquinone/menaquinone biosynthesis C-methylase UbiE
MGFLPEPSPILMRYIRTGTILDVGCGKGDFCAVLLRKGYAVIGIDINRLRARQTSSLTDVSVGDCRALPFRERSFDLVCIMQVLHHIEKPEAALDEISRVAKNDGWLFITESVEDNLLFKFLRNVHPSYEGDAVKTRFKRAELRQMLASRFSTVSESTSNGNFYWLWWLFGSRIMDPHKLDNCFVTSLICFMERQLDKALKGRFSCRYEAILRSRAEQ